MIEPAHLLVGSRFLFDTASLFLWGAGLFAWLLAPGDLGTAIWRRLAPARYVAMLAVALAVAVMLPTRAAGLGNGWSSALDGKLIWLMLWNTGIGSAWLVQACGTLLLVALVLSRRPWPAAAALLAGLMLASTVLTGHAAMSSGWQKLFHQFSSALHVLSAGAWVGALVPVLMILPHLKSAQAPAARQALVRFSTAGHFAVATVTLSGIVSAVLILDRLPSRFDSTYEVLLLTKIAIVTVMIGVAIANRYCFVPLLRANAGAHKWLVFGTAAEIALTAVVVGLVAWFGTLSPVTVG